MEESSEPDVDMSLVDGLGTWQVGVGAYSVIFLQLTSRRHMLLSAGWSIDSLGTLFLSCRDSARMNVAGLDANLWCTRLVLN